MNEYVIVVNTVQELSDWELDELRQGVVDWFSPEDGEEFSIDVKEGDK